MEWYTEMKTCRQCFTDSVFTLWLWVWEINRQLTKIKLYYALYSKYEAMMDDENDHEFRGEMVIYTAHETARYTQVTLKIGMKIRITNTM